MSDGKPWQWWAGTNGEHYISGPLDTREEAVRIVTEEYEGGYICEAYQEPLDVSKQFDADTFMEQVEEYCHENLAGDDGPDDFTGGITKEQMHDLQECVRMTIQRWQKRWGVEIKPYLFTEARNEEFIAAEGQDDES